MRWYTTPPARKNQTGEAGVSVSTGRPEAAAVVWNWRDRATGFRKVTAGRVRLRGLLQAALAALLGSAILFFWSRAIGTAVLAIATIVAFSALASPLGLFAAIERLFLTLGHATGTLLTWILLVPVFYGFFVPFGRLMRRGRRDRLKRHLEADAETYWEPHAGPTAASTSHERQY
jgi:hypothetical protein